jgi:hypothetical protein
MAKVVEGGLVVSWKDRGKQRMDSYFGLQVV